ncbi:unnamed protein product [Menidia menidia]|uniref:(Atlantic silverside) hypothetical protein n=1 Tax=Menidia menidia TaxID=238744 RepID=A0A8S4BMF2_9TELE|nr:unnamed protein product [Menidia menidia]
MLENSYVWPSLEVLLYSFWFDSCPSPLRLKKKKKKKKKKEKKKKKKMCFVGRKETKQRGSMAVGVGWYVLSIMGRRRTLPNIDSPDWGLRMQAERQAVNFVVQGSAADLCKMAMIQIFNLVSTSSSPSARLLAQLHDELLYEVEDSQVEPFAALVRSTMESLQHIDHLGVHLKVPLKVSVSSGKSWGSMSELLPPS